MEQAFPRRSDPLKATSQSLILVMEYPILDIEVRMLWIIGILLQPVPQVCRVHVLLISFVALEPLIIRGQYIWGRTVGAIYRDTCFETQINSFDPLFLKYRYISVPGSFSLVALAISSKHAMTFGEDVRNLLNHPA